ncbi:hypothetical protein BD410DRAFT_786789 [Rickenella mellea]|uniref:Uncharacterized protein n=1 Tax=Rickenella mellea TaxID=50990 RepID=A0A4Y7Q924_9AGAM|nr:hypothetical protein BD410DRAFT_786789 [Rickenella mellea]
MATGTSKRPYDWTPDPHILLNVLVKSASDNIRSDFGTWPPNEKYFSHHPGYLSGTLPPDEPSEIGTTAKALDALAAVCTFKSSGQTTAVSLTLTSDERAIIVIAQNEDIDERVIRFVTDLWTSLSKLSSLIAQYGHADSPGLEPAKRSSLDSQYRAVKALVYRHGLCRVQHAFFKRWCDFKAFIQDLEHTSGDRDLRSHLKLAYNIMSSIVNVLGSPISESTSDLTLLVEDMDKLQQKCLELFKDEEKLNRWVNECQKPVGKVFPLSKYLKMCIEVQKDCSALIAFASTKRHHHILCKTMYVKAITSEKLDLAPFLDSVNLDKYADMAIEMAEKIMSPFLTRNWDDEKQRIKDYASVMRESALLHPECAILAYHDRTLLLQDGDEHGAESNAPPFIYIGTSKAPCYACCLLFRAYRKRQLGLPLLTQVSSMKVRTPWVMPLLSDEKIAASAREALYMQFCIDYAKYLSNRISTGRAEPISRKTKI